METIERNLVVGLDGTWNDAHYNPSEDPASSCATNVCRAINACQYRRDQPTPRYEAGVGTKVGEGISGGLWGDGLDEQVLGAYRFIRNRFQDDDADYRDRIFIFGFSRGAYAARRLSGFISRCGITRDKRDDQSLWDAYNRQDGDAIDMFRREGKTIDASIRFLGVWDTVKSTNDPDFDDYELPIGVESAYHAIALDERRANFDVLRFKVDHRVTQTWFSGVHGDIGGGYDDCGQADITLRWMLQEAARKGLKVKPDVMQQLATDPCMPLNESFTDEWVYLGEHRRVVVLPDDAVHFSVEQRREQHRDYAPPNLA